MEWTFVSESYGALPPPHKGVWRVHRSGVGFFEASVCYGMHMPWWVPRNGFTKQESEPIDIKPGDA